MEAAVDPPFKHFSKMNQTSGTSPLLWYQRALYSVSSKMHSSSSSDEYETLPLTQSSATEFEYDAVATSNKEISPDAPVQSSFSRCLSNAWKNYNILIETRPVLAKGVTAFFILGLADICAQGVEHLRGSSTASAVDWLRTARFGVFGLLGAPWSHFYFYYLDKWLPPTPEPFTKTTIIKVCIDQFIQAPTLLAIMISALSLMKGEGFRGVKRDLIDNFWISLIANWKLWIPASLVNLAFVKPTLRVLYVNVVFFVWTIILSIILNSNSTER